MLGLMEPGNVLLVKKSVISVTISAASGQAGRRQLMNMFSFLQQQ